MKAETVGWDHKAVFHEGKTPGDEYDDVEGCVAVDDVHVLELEVSVPCEGHEDVGDDE